MSTHAQNPQQPVTSVPGKPVTHPASAADTTSHISQESMYEFRNILQIQAKYLEEKMELQAATITDKVEGRIKKVIISAIELGLEVSELSEKELKEKIYSLVHSSDEDEKATGKIMAKVAAMKARDEARRMEALSK